MMARQQHARRRGAKTWAALVVAACLLCILQGGATQYAVGPDLCAEAGTGALSNLPSFIETAVTKENVQQALSCGLAFSLNHISSASDKLRVCEAVFKTGAFDIVSVICEKAAIAVGATARAWLVYGNALCGAGELSKALPYLQKASQSPLTANDAYNNLGNVLASMDKLEEASVAFEHALKVNSDNIEPLINVMALLIRTGRGLEASRRLSKYTHLLPIVDKDVLMLLYDAARATGEKQLAVGWRLILARLASKNKHKEYANAAVVAAEARQDDMSLLLCEYALGAAMKVGDAAVLHIASRLSHGLWSAGLRGSAVDVLDAAATRVLPLSSPDFEALANFAKGYYQVREYDSAVAMLENAHSNGNSSLDSRCLLLKLYGSTANWEGLREWSEVLGAIDVELGSSGAIERRRNSVSDCLQVNDAMYMDIPIQTLRLLARRLCETALVAARKITRWLPPFKYPFSRKLSIGYLSSDMKASHPIGQAILPLLEAHADVISVLCISNRVEAPVESMHSWDSRMNRACTGGWMNLVNLADRDVAEVVNSAKLNVLLNLNGWSGFDRSAVLATKPAPVQINFLGYAQSAGGGSSYGIDGVVTDPVASPPDLALFYDERLVMLQAPHHFLGQAAYYHPVQPRSDAARLREGLPRLGEAAVIVVLSRVKKITARVWSTWLEVLKEVPDSQLWITEVSMTNMTLQRLRDGAKSEGISADRIVPLKAFSAKVHIQVKSLADVLADTSPYGAHMSAGDALFANVPVVTFPEESMCSRIAASFLAGAGAVSGLTRSLPDYGSVLKAASRRGGLGAASLRNEWTQNKGVVFDVVAWARRWERALQNVADMTIATERGAFHFIAA